MDDGGWTAVWLGWVGKAQGMGGAWEDGVDGAKGELARLLGPNREDRAAGDMYIISTSNRLVDT